MDSSNMLHKSYAEKHLQVLVQRLDKLERYVVLKEDVREKFYDDYCVCPVYKTGVKRGLKLKYEEVEHELEQMFWYIEQLNVQIEEYSKIIFAINKAEHASYLGRIIYDSEAQCNCDVCQDGYMEFWNYNSEYSE